MAYMNVKIIRKLTFFVVTLLLIASQSTTAAADDATTTIPEKTIPERMTTVEPKTCNVPSINNGRFLLASDSDMKLPAVVPVGTAIRLACLKGFVKTGAEEMLCYGKDSWFPAPGSCAKPEPTQPTTEATTIATTPKPKCSVPNVRGGGQLVKLGGTTSIQLITVEAGTILNFQCPSGSTVIGASQILCRQDGNWFPELGTCLPETTTMAPTTQTTTLPGKCSIPNLTVGRFFGGSSSNFVFVGEMVSLKCPSGYIYEGAKQSLCRSEEKWFPALGRCQELATTTSTLPPTTIRQFCSIPKISGGRFAKVERDELSSKSVQAGGKIRLDCKTRFDPSGATESLCVGQDSWFPEPGSCVPKIETTTTTTTTSTAPTTAPPSKCDVTKVAVGKLVKYGEGQTSGMSESSVEVDTVLALDCPEGYQVFGSKHQICRSNGSWFPERIGTCEPEPTTTTTTTSPTTIPTTTPPNQCKVPRVEVGRFVKPGTKTALSGGQIVAGNSIRLDCPSGFELVGAPEIFCRSSDSWFPELGKCVKPATTPSPPSCSLPEVANGKAVAKKRLRNLDYGDASILPEGTFQLGTKISIECSNRYQLEGFNESVCLGSNNWFPSVGTCTLIPESTTSTTLTTITTTTTTSTTAEVKCLVPALPVGNVAMVGSTLNFVPKHVLAGTMVEVSCPNGYLLNGPSRSSCQGQDLWNPPIATCLPIPSTTTLPATTAEIMCLVPTSRKGKVSLVGSTMNFVPKNVLLGTVVEISCHPGSSLDGSSRSVCQGPNVWAPKLGTCVEPMVTTTEKSIVRSGNVEPKSAPARIMPAADPTTLSPLPINPAKASSDECSVPALPGTKIAIVGSQFPFVPKLVYQGTAVAIACPGGVVDGPSQAVCRGGDRWEPALGSCRQSMSPAPALTNLPADTSNECVVPTLPGAKIVILGSQFPFVPKLVYGGTAIAITCPGGGLKQTMCQGGNQWAPPVDSCNPSTSSTSTGRGSETRLAGDQNNVVPPGSSGSSGTSGRSPSSLPSNESQSPIHMAVKSGDIKTVEFLVGLRPELLELKNAKNQTPLVAAVIDDRLDVARFLVQDKKANVESQDETRRTALIHAADRGNEAIVNLLLQNGANVRASDRSGNTAVHYAAKGGYDQILGVLLQKDRALVDVANAHGSTPLAVALSSGRLKTANALLDDFKADINARAPKGRTPLMYAVEANQLPAVQLLVQKGANVLAKDEAGKTAIDMATESGKTQIANYLSSATAPSAATTTATIEKCPIPLTDAGHWAVQGPHGFKQLTAPVNVRVGTKLFLYCPVPFVTSGSDAVTCAAAKTWQPSPGNCASAPKELKILAKRLRNAVKENNLDKVKATFSDSMPASHVRLLVDHKTNSMPSWTPVMTAAANGALPIVEFLVGAKSANLSRRADLNGAMVIHIAAEYGRNDVARYLLARDPGQVTAKTSRNDTALNLAAEKGNLELVKILVEQKGVEVNNRGFKGRTPLAMAANAGHLEVGKVLLEKGAIWSVKDDDGNTAFNLAEKAGHRQIIDFAVEKMASRLRAAIQQSRVDEVRSILQGEARFLVNLKGEPPLGLTPLMEAAAVGSLPTVQILVANGADVTLRSDQLGSMAISMGAEAGHLEVVKYLAGLNADSVETKGLDNSTPLNWGAVGGHLPVVRFLVEERRANIENEDKDGRTPLMSAASTGHLEVVKFLVDRGANVLHRDKFGDMAVHLAGYFNQNQVVAYLVKRFPNLRNEKDGSGYLPIIKE